VPDHVDLVLSQWAAERPDLDVSAMGVIGRLGRVQRLFEAEMRATFARHDLDSPSFDVLATLRRSGGEGLTPAGLMRAGMVTSGAITQRLDRLEERGLVRRAPSDADRRSVLVSLTDTGRALVDSALPDHVATEERLLAGLDAAQREHLASTLRTVLEHHGDEA
jgi:DNA-binding MarR family transcriptional regulator